MFQTNPKRLHPCRRCREGQESENGLCTGCTVCRGRMDVQERRLNEPRYSEGECENGVSTNLGISVWRMQKSGVGFGCPSGLMFQTNPKRLHPCRRCREGHDRRDAGGRTNQETESRSPRMAYVQRCTVCRGRMDAQERRRKQPRYPLVALAVRTAYVHGSKTILNFIPFPLLKYCDDKIYGLC